MSGGRHEGLSGRIVDVEDDRYGVRLTRSDEVVKISGEKLLIVDEPQLHYDRKHGLVSGSDLRKYAKIPSNVSSSRYDHGEKSSKREDRSRENKDREKDREESSKSRGDTSSRGDRESSSKKSHRDEKASSKGAMEVDSPTSWLQPHIRVRIVSQKISGGMFYLKKGDVVDISRPGSAVIRMEDGQLCEG